MLGPLFEFGFIWHEYAKISKKGGNRKSKEKKMAHIEVKVRRGVLAVNLEDDYERGSNDRSFFYE